ncbi:MAG TPA: hypothetical protein VEF35_02385 [Candidatus Bathyarchaeia archaeon]|nr:hypothetical protein [Candidatus Bathyarchaeia archaeon]
MEKDREQRRRVLINDRQEASANDELSKVMDEAQQTEAEACESVPWQC